MNPSRHRCLDPHTRRLLGVVVVQSGLAWRWAGQRKVWTWDLLPGELA